jgi:hypothetical protein
MVGFGYYSIETERRIKTIQPASQRRRVDDTISHLSSNWFPVNPDLLKLVKEKTKGGIYSRDRDELVNDVKQDPALFVYCARNLKNLSKDSTKGLDPLNELRKLEDEKLETLFNVTPSKVSTHHLTNISKHQARRLQFSLVSTHTAEALASEMDLSTEQAFSSIAFRQLGLNLIAWNYPRIYDQAVKKQRQKDYSLDLELQKFLKVTPARIGLHFATSWGMNPEIKHALSPRMTSSPAEEQQEQTSYSAPPLNMQALCELSELYAQLKDPFTYPQAEDKWESMEPFINKVVDPHVFEKADEKVHDIISTYDDNSTSISSLPLIEEFQFTEGYYSTRGKELFQKNSYVKRCPEHIQKMFFEVYQKFGQSEVAVEAIKQLVDSLIPAVGFKRGCLFLRNKEDLSLKPALRIGDYLLSEYEKLLKDKESDIASALTSLVPTRKDGTGITGKTVTQISCSLNNPEHPGILYMELSEESSQATDHDTLRLFKAIKQTFNDCIGSGDD